jgi:hypothetical protein
MKPKKKELYKILVIIQEKLTLVILARVWEVLWVAWKQMEYDLERCQCSSYYGGLLSGALIGILTIQTWWWTIAFAYKI